VIQELGAAVTAETRPGQLHSIADMIPRNSPGSPFVPTPGFLDVLCFLKGKVLRQRNLLSVFWWELKEGTEGHE
jgi:hypothetical protein